MTSTTSCGACGNACRPGETCVGGMCVCDTGFACNSDEQCVDMGGPAKVCYCPSAMTVCPGTPDATCCGESTCSDTRSDARNCGPSCERCGSGEVCNAGACSCPDAPGGAACTGPFAICCPGAGCVNRLTDPNHCSMCGNACAAGFACQSGSCRCGSVSNSCPANEVCDPTEVPPRCECGSNPTCPAGLSCNAMGFCV
ncbi:MAG: hypothetical protein H6719_21485 [Sandaracinaceae bacterium]|nr:hypothetical protein [Sandaracinaceae bacterium]